MQGRKQKPPPPPKMYFSPDELKALQLGLGRVMDDIQKVKNDPSIPWTPKSREELKSINGHVTSAAAKIEKLTGVKTQLPEYKEGDEEEFLTKES